MLNEIKVLKFSSIYSGLVSKISQEVTSEMTSDEAMEAIFKKRFGLSNFYEQELLKLNVQAKDLLLGVDSIDEKLREENKIEKDKNLLISMIEKYHPSVVFIQDFSLVNEQVAAFLRSNKNKIICLGYLCSPIGKSIKFLDAFDAVLTCTPGFMEFFKNNTIKSFRLNHAFSMDIFNTILDDHDFFNRKKSIVFSGSIFPGGQYHNQRIRGIYELKNQLGNKVDLFLGKKKLNCSLKSIYKILCSFDYTKISKIGTIEANMMKDLLMSESEDLIFGLEMYEQFSKHQFVFNQHVNVAGNYAGNVRLFEATGMGACLLTDKKSNMHDYFDDDEVVMYDSIDEAKEKLIWLLDHPNDAYKIALKGQKKTFLKHTYKVRAEELLNIISELSK